MIEVPVGVAMLVAILVALGGSVAGYMAAEFRGAPHLLQRLKEEAGRADAWAERYRTASRELQEATARIDQLEVVINRVRIELSMMHPPVDLEEEGDNNA